MTLDLSPDIRKSVLGEPGGEGACGRVDESLLLDAMRRLTPEFVKAGSRTVPTESRGMEH
jgi:hypothetical protein